MPSIAYLDLKYDKSYFTNKIYDNAITLTALVDDCQIGLYNAHHAKSFSISYDNGMTWTDIDFADERTFYYPDPIDTGQTIMIVGHENYHDYGCRGLYIFSEEDNYFNVSGNLTSLLDSDIALVEREWANSQDMYGCFQNLFGSFNDSGTIYKSYVKDASDLVFTNLDPEPYFYSYMFNDCTSLEKAPKTLSANIGPYCYYMMFKGCTSLTTAPELPATTLAISCYSGMFGGCTSLTTAPELPATTLANNCYNSMFKNCTSLVVAPRLNATTLIYQCYQSMFEGCTSLTTAPELHATILTTKCYQSMFKGCTSLTTAPELPATELKSRCYQEMFNGCTSLNYIKILATSWPANTYLEDHIEDWVENVAPTGIFVKDTNTIYEIDSTSGVPVGWTVYDVGEYIPQTYTVTIDVDPTGSGLVSGAGDYLEGTNVIVVANPSAGYRFAGWYNGLGTLVSTNPMYTFTITRHENFLAQFTEIVYYNVALTQDPSIGATLTGAGTYESDSSVTVIASVVSGYEFLGWSLNGTIISTSTSYTFTLDSDITLTATYKEYNDYNHMYFTIQAIDDYLQVVLSAQNYYNSSRSNFNLWYQKNNDPWQKITFDYSQNDPYTGWSNSRTICTLRSNETVKIHTDAHTLNSTTASFLSLFSIFNQAEPNPGNKTANEYQYNARFNVYGNILSLIDYPSATSDGPNYGNPDYPTFSGITLLTNVFKSLFETMQVVSANNLRMPNIELSSAAFESAFYACKYLTTAPELPTTTLAQWCYKEMFAYCTSLTTAPELPATTLAASCYHSMFYNCKKLITAPDLSATTLVDDCYCDMFNGCTSLTTAPELPATTLADYCYRDMFSGCTSLTTAPELPATTLAISCYQEMFGGCTSLTTAPELPATTLAKSCYDKMFLQCESLNYVKCLATSIVQGSTTNWLYLVANNGTFVKDSNMTWSTGPDGIPTGWAVVDAS